MGWDAKTPKDGGQSLIVDEGTGRTVAVVYDPRDAELLANAVRLECRLRDMVELVRIIDMTALRPSFRDRVADTQRLLYSLPRYSTGDENEDHDME